MHAEVIISGTVDGVTQILTNLQTRTPEEAKSLIEKGFSYECTIDSVPLFKKVKTNSDPGECKSGPREV
jgi:hypothetical protein